MTPPVAPELGGSTRRFRSRSRCPPANGTSAAPGERHRAAHAHRRALSRCRRCRLPPPASPCRRRSRSTTRSASRAASRRASPTRARASAASRAPSTRPRAFRVWPRPSAPQWSARPFPVDDAAPVHAAPGRRPARGAAAARPSSTRPRARPRRRRRGHRPCRPRRRRPRRQAAAPPSPPPHPLRAFFSPTWCTALRGAARW